MESVAMPSETQRPAYPRFPIRAALGIWVVIAIVVFGSLLIELSVWGTLVTIALASGAIGEAIGTYNEAVRRFRIDDFRWKLSNVEDSVSLRETTLRAGQPLSSEEDPAKWHSDRELAISESKLKIDDLRQQLEDALQHGK